MSLTYAQVYALALASGLTPQQAITATAISGAEVNGKDVGLPINPAAVGDVKLANATWGPSVGLWQVRTLKAETGTGRARDINILTNPQQNARAMAEISAKGTNWSPWSTYNDGLYRLHLPAATAAAKGAPGTTSPPIVSATYPAGQTVTVANGNSPFDVDVDLGPLSGPVEGLIKAAGPILLGSLIVAGGVALVILGLSKAAK